ncbi:hypothetical protein EXS73_02645 [Candidatus Pacearchaeota archaeon]|nr:hypothetical protein [Candidatus Pacearchaeota archaeon]
MLSFQTEKDRPGIVYALSRLLHEQAHAQIHGMQAVVTPTHVENHFFFNIRPYDRHAPLSFSEAQTRLKTYLE